MKLKQTPKYSWCSDKKPATTTLKQLHCRKSQALITRHDLVRQALPRQMLLVYYLLLSLLLST